MYLGDVSHVCILVWGTIYIGVYNIIMYVIWIVIILSHLEGDLIEDTSTATTHLTTKKRNSPSRTISMNSIASIPGASSTQMRDSQTANIAPALTSTSTNTVSTNTVRGSGAPESIYILIGAAIAGLLMLGITITTLVLCVWQCKKTKGKHYYTFFY